MASTTPAKKNKFKGIPLNKEQVNSIKSYPMFNRLIKLRNLSRITTH